MSNEFGLKKTQKDMLKCSTSQPEGHAQGLLDQWRPQPDGTPASPPPTWPARRERNQRLELRIDALAAGSKDSRTSVLQVPRKESGTLARPSEAESLVTDPCAGEPSISGQLDGAVAIARIRATS
jgi:hypothetical protein